MCCQMFPLLDYQLYFYSTESLDTYICSILCSYTEKKQQQKTHHNATIIEIKNGNYYLSEHTHNCIVTKISLSVISRPQFINQSQP